MKEFIKALREASSAMLNMSIEWQKLERNDDDIVQGFTQWGDAFNVSLDEVPSYMWSIVDALESLSVAVSWDDATALTDGVTIHCKSCTLEFKKKDDDAQGESTLDQYLSSAHRGGFIPISIKGIKCHECGIEVL